MNTRNTASEAPLRAISNPAGIISPPQPRPAGESEHRFGRPDGQMADLPLRTSPPSAGEAAADPGGQQPDPMIGSIIAGRYRLLAKLGQGGMAVVYKGEHLRMDRLVAIKLLSPRLSGRPEFVARFHREAEMVSHLNHPNVVATYDFGEAEDGLLYLAMEFLDGQPLSALINHEGPLAPERVVKLIWQAAAALHAAHHLGLIHRDFKPDNAMVCKRAGQVDWVKVVDFGVAKWLRVPPREKVLTRRGLVLGTPQYMSPEQVAGKELDARSDLYSLALVTYEMLAGAPPFAGSKPQRQMNEPPLPFPHFRPQLVLPAAVEPVIRKALARDPDERYSSTLEFAMALEAAARGESLCQLQPVEAQPLARASGGAGGQKTITEQAERTSPLDQAVQEAT